MTVEECRRVSGRESSQEGDTVRRRAGSRPFLGNGHSERDPLVVVPAQNTDYFADQADRLSYSGLTRAVAYAQQQLMTRRLPQAPLRQTRLRLAGWKDEVNFLGGNARILCQPLGQAAVLGEEAGRTLVHTRVRGERVSLPWAQIDEVRIR